MEPKVTFFLGANSPSGFYSLYDQMLAPEEARRVFLLKGGAGCGKSSLMKQVAAALEDAGESVEYIRCSGDPDSLDAVIFPRLKAAIVDATAPHGGVTERQRECRSRKPHGRHLKVSTVIKVSFLFQKETIKGGQKGKSFLRFMRRKGIHGGTGREREKYREPRKGAGYR